MAFKNILAGLIPVLIIIDQLSKWAITELALRPLAGEASLSLMQWITDAPQRLGFVSREILPFFNLTMVWNFGVSFGLFNNGSESGALILSVVAALISIAFGIWLYRSTSKLQSLALALVIAGAIGNIIDRLRFGAVIDFLDFHAIGWHYPAFNLADSLIVVGIFALLYHALFLEKPNMTE